MTESSFLISSPFPWRLQTDHFRNKHCFEFCNPFLRSCPNAQEVASSITLPDTIPVHDIRFSDMGLAGYTPTGLFQQLIEVFSVNGHVPFCASIMFSTVAIRLVLSPLASPLMRETSRFLESLPELGEGEKQRQLDIRGVKGMGGNQRQK